MEAVRSSEISANFYKNKHRHVPEDNILIVTAVKTSNTA
jgi:hypothetical protein